MFITLNTTIKRHFQDYSISYFCCKKEVLTSLKSHDPFHWVKNNTYHISCNTINITLVLSAGIVYIQEDIPIFLGATLKHK